MIDVIQALTDVLNELRMMPETNSAAIKLIEQARVELYTQRDKRSPISQVLGPTSPASGDASARGQSPRE